MKMGYPYVYNLTIPPAVNWYEASVMTYTPNDMLIYGSKGDLIIMKDVANKSLQHAQVEIMRRVHSQRITSLGINPKWGEKDYSLLVTTAEDKFVKVWDMETQHMKGNHQQHLNSTKIVSAAFAGADRVVSVSDDGLVIVWRFNNNEIKHLKKLITTKSTVTCLSICPHYPKLATFGLKNGLILVANLDGNGTVLHRLRGHDKEVISMDWCPIPFNIFPTSCTNKVLITPEQFRIARKEDTDTIILNLMQEIVESVAIHIEEASVARHIGEASASTNIEETSVATNIDETSVATNIEETSAATNIEETSVATNIEETSVATNIEETSVATNIEETSVATNIEDTSVATNIEETSVATNIEETSVATNIEETSVATNIEETSVATNIEETSVATNIEEASVATNIEETSVATNIEETSVAKNIDVSSTTHQTEPDQTKSETSPEKTILKHPQADPPKPSTEQDQSTPGTSSKITILRRPQAESPEDSTKLAQKMLWKILHIDSPRSDTELAKDGSEDEQNKEDSVSVTEDTNTPLPANIEPDDVPEPSTSKRLGPSDLALQDLVTLPPCAIKPYCGTCKRDEGCSCRNAVKMITDTVEQATNEFLLVSSAREPTIIVWKIGSEAKSQTYLRIPTKIQKNRRPSDKLWITVKWPLPNKIYSSSRNNELIQWTVPAPISREREYMKIIHDDHSSMIFTIATSVEDFIHKNWVIPTEHIVWTSSHDRQIICYKIDGEESEIERLASYPTFAGIPECLAANKLNPYRVAIGTAAGILKIWDLSAGTGKFVKMQKFTQKIHSRVTCAAWQPDNGDIVAFGTQEGRVGIFDVTESSGVPKLMPHTFTNEIYQIQWAPIKRDLFVLYVSAEGKLVYWNTETPETAPVVVQVPENQTVYNFNWKLDYSRLLISLKSGLLLTYSAELRKIHSLRFAQKFTLLTWNSLSYMSSSRVLTYCNTYAAVIQRNTLVVMDHQKQTKDFESKILGKYVVDKDQINTIAWSNYGTRLAIGTENGFVFIWDLPAQALVWTFTNPTFQGITSLITSPFGTEHIICSTKDCCLKVFLQRQHPAIDAPTLSIKRSMIVERKEEESKKIRDDTLRKVGVSDDKSKKEKTKNAVELLPVFHRSRTSPTQFLADIRRLYKYVTEAVLERDGSSDVDLLDIFGSQDAMSQLVARNQSIMRDRGRGLDLPLAMFISDSPNFLIEAVRKRRVTPAIIALAPYVSQRLWIEAVTTYADILSEDPDSDPIEAVTYYLATHRVREAVRFLISRNMFKEALALAKCRCPPESNAVRGVIQAWGKYALQNGNFERAAECFIYLGKFEDAVAALFKRTEPEVLLFAAELAHKIGNSELETAALYRYQTFTNQGENTRQSLKTDTIADVLMNVRKKDRDTAEPSTSSVEDTAGPAVTEDGTTPQPSFLYDVQPLLLEDDIAASASSSSILSDSSETFLTRGYQDPDSHIVPVEDEYGDRSEAIIAAIRSRVLEEAEEARMAFDASSGETTSTTSQPSPRLEKKPSSSDLPQE